jgi:hypothetical protein
MQREILVQIQVRQHVTSNSNRLTAFQPFLAICFSTNPPRNISRAGRLKNCVKSVSVSKQPEPTHLELQELNICAPTSGITPLT